MAKAKGGLNKNSSYIPGPPKKSRQGMGAGTKYAATSRNEIVKSTEVKANERRNSYTSRRNTSTTGF